MFVAMNRFRVVPEQEGEWERIWKERETYLQGHAQGSLHGVLAGSPELGLFQAVLWEEAGREREDDASDPVAGRQGPRH